MNNDPLIDKRSWKDIVEQANALASIYIPEWKPQEDDPGQVLIFLFSRLMEIVIDRLNKVPGKNFLTFLDVAGITHLAPKAARAPVRFTLSAGAKNEGCAPQGTQLATSPPPGQEPVTFETEKALVVHPSRLKKLFSHNPAADSYSNYEAVLTSNEKNKNKEFQPFMGEELIPHRLYMGHDILFNINHHTELELILGIDQAKESYKNFFEELTWSIYTSGQEKGLTPARIALNKKKKEISIALEAARIEKTKIKDTEAYFFWSQTKKPLSASEASLEITYIKCKSKAENILPDSAFFNAIPIDTYQGFFPFGERPKQNETFFLAVSEVFSKEGSRISIHVDVRSGAAPGPDGISLLLEFWDGNTWTLLGETTERGVHKEQGKYGFIDTTNAFTIAMATDAKAKDTSGPILGFNCPKIEKTNKVWGKEDYWIRVRITQGNYGEDAKMKPKEGIKDPESLEDWEYVPPSFKPPCIKSIHISYEYQDAQDLTACWTYNNFTYEKIERKKGIEDKEEHKGFKPFICPVETKPALYMGFDKPFSNKTVNLYFSIIESVMVGEAVVVWEYWNGDLWRNLGVQDETRNFASSGIVEFRGPADFKAKEGFGSDLYWIRARLDKQDRSDTKLLCVYTNTIWAKQCVTVTSEILGSSSETPNETFHLSHFPVLEGQKIEIREHEKPSEEEIQRLIKEEGEDAITPVSDEEGASGGYWVRWHEVPNFSFSDQKSRHYLIDRSIGRIALGNGTHGMVAPGGRDNIRASFYQAGGGEKGNVPENSITILKRAIPFVDKVFNVDKAGGGSEIESLDQIKARGSQTIKHRNRAVTCEDYEWLAQEASLQVARAKCLPAKDSDRAGSVVLIIVPNSDDPKPSPSQGLIEQVNNYLGTRRISTANLMIIGPKYIEVSVKAVIYPERMDEADFVRQAVKERLENYFHPLKGGPDEKGWAFGRDVYVSEICKVIEDTEGVNHAEGVEICSSYYEDGMPAITIPENRDLTELLYQVAVGDDYMVTSGDHQLLIPGIAEPPPDSAPFLGNAGTKELHFLKNIQNNCRISKILPENKRFFICFSEALKEGYDFCAWCFGREISTR